MPLNIPFNFSNDLKGRDTNLFPIVVIGGWDDGQHIDDNSIFISTNSISLATTTTYIDIMNQVEEIIDNISYAPILVNIPSLKESIDIEKRNYKVSSINLDISNFPHNGERFSELIGSDSLINTECRIFWVSPSVNKVIPVDLFGITDFGDAFQIYYGNIRRYTHDDEKVRLVVEDKSQATLHKDLPLPEDRLTEENGYTNVPNKYKGKGIPMVFGWVDKSPSVIASIPTPVSSGEDFGQLNVGEIELLFDSNDSSSIVNNKAWENSLILDDHFYLYDNDDFFKIPQFITEYDASALAEYDILGFKISETNNQYIQDENLNAIKLQSKLLDELSVGAFLSDGNTIYNDCVLVRKVLTPANGLIVGAVRERFELDDHSNPADRMLYTSLGLRMNNETGNEIVGTMLMEYENRPTTWDGSSSLVGVGETQHSTPMDINDGEDLIYTGFGQYAPSDTTGEWCTIGANITAPAFGFDDQVGYWYIRYSLYASNRTLIDSESDTTANIELISILLPSGENKKSDEYDIDDIVDNADSWTLISGASNRINRLLDYDSTNSCAIVAGLQSAYDSQFAGNLYISQAVKYAWGRVNNVISKEYYASVFGRGVVLTSSGQFDIGVSAPKAIGLIMNHIGVSDIESPPSDYIYAFTVEKINSKKLIEGIASASSFIPRFNNMGVFKFTEIPNGGGTADFQIEEADVIDFSFSKTKIEDVYTKIVFHYNWDYAIGEFSDSVTVKMDDDIIDGYSLDYYGFKTIDGDEHAESTLEIEDDRGKYIRDYGTALNFALWYLMWSCNQHLKMKVKLPLKYMNLEVGDLVQFDEVVGGIEPFNINYKVADTVNEQVVFNTFLITSTNKTLDGVQIECVQMHDLQYWLNLTLGCHTEGACNYDEDADTDDGSCYWAEENHDCEGNCLLDIDACGVCGGDATCCPPDVLDCNGDCNGSAVVDECGICGGDNTSCADCAGTPNGDAVEDECGECNGDNSTCSGCMDGDALNFDPDATIDDGSCEYPFVCRPQLDYVLVGIQNEATTDVLEFDNDNDVEDCNPLFDQESPLPSTSVNNAIVSLKYFWVRFGGNCLEGRMVKGVRYKLKNEDDVTNLINEGNDFYDGWCTGGCFDDPDDVDDTATVYHLWSPGATDEIQPFFELNDPSDGSLHLVEMQFEITTVDCITEEEIVYIEDVKFELEHTACGNMGDIDADGNWNVLDIVALCNCVLAGGGAEGAGLPCDEIENGCAGDMNGDGGYNVLDIVTLANCVLASNCGG